MLSANLLDVAAAVLQPVVLFYIVFGVTVGYLVGVVPGLNRPVAIALSIPLTFHMPPLAAISFLIGISKGSATGGSVTAILINTPGEPSSAATCLDGYPMARSGQARKALQIALFASVIGDFIGTIILIALAAPLAKYALLFGPIELTAILIFSLTFIASLSGSSLLKGLAAAAIGVMFASVGVDPETSVPRLTFGLPELLEGIPIAVVAVGALALTEMLIQIEEMTKRRHQGHQVEQFDATGSSLTRGEFFTCLPAILRGTTIGTIIGALPGLGATVASFLSYAWARRSSKTPEDFGKGTPVGVAAAESADNAVVPASLIPLFGLGIPGSVAAALLVGAFLVHGLPVGPLLFTQHPQLIQSVYVGMIVATLVMLIIGSFGLRLFAQLTKLPEQIVVPSVIFLCVAGAYLEASSMFNVSLMLLFAVLGYVMRKLDLSIVTFLIGFIIAPNLELSLRQALVVTDGDVTVLAKHPIALVFLALTVLSTIPGLIASIGRRTAGHINQKPEPQRGTA